MLKPTDAIGRAVKMLAGRLPQPEPIGIIAANGPLPIPCGRITVEVRVSDFPFLVTTVTSVPLVDGATAGVYVALIVQSEQSGLGPISYFSMLALISLRRRSQFANEVSRVPAANRNGSGKGRTIGSCSKLGKTGGAKPAPVFSTSKTSGTLVSPDVFS